MLSVQPEDDGRTLVVAGEIDLASVADLVGAARAMGEGACSRLDMRGVTFIDSTGIRALIELARAAKGELELVGVQPPVRRVLDLVGLETHLPLRVVDAEEPDRGDP
jgi:anti-anti-sigma factor